MMLTKLEEKIDTAIATIPTLKFTTSNWRNGRLGYGGEQLANLDVSKFFSGEQWGQLLVLVYLVEHWQQIEASLSSGKDRQKEHFADSQKFIQELQKQYPTLLSELQASMNDEDVKTPLLNKAIVLAGTAQRLFNASQLHLHSYDVQMEGGIWERLREKMSKRANEQNIDWNMDASICSSAISALERTLQSILSSEDVTRVIDDLHSLHKEVFQPTYMTDKAALYTHAARVFNMTSDLLRAKREQGINPDQLARVNNALSRLLSLFEQRIIQSVDSRATYF
jgi:macrodomain Ter protein organizer (MatP/YcbG family)